jgi:hypothetical protein
MPHNRHVKQIAKELKRPIRRSGRIPGRVRVMRATTEDTKTQHVKRTGEATVLSKNGRGVIRFREGFFGKGSGEEEHEIHDVHGGGLPMVVSTKDKEGRRHSWQLNKGGLGGI